MSADITILSEQEIRDAMREFGFMDDADHRASYGQPMTAPEQAEHDNVVAFARAIESKAITKLAEQAGQFPDGLSRVSVELLDEFRIYAAGMHTIYARTAAQRDALQRHLDKLAQVVELEAVARVFYEWPDTGPKLGWNSYAAMNAAILDESRQEVKLVHLSTAQAAVAAERAKAHRCKGIPREGCDYLASCGSICNKCGREHTLSTQSSPAPAAEPVPPCVICSSPRNYVMHSVACPDCKAELVPAEMHDENLKRYQAAQATPSPLPAAAGVEERAGLAKAVHKAVSAACGKWSDVRSHSTGETIVSRCDEAHAAEAEAHAAIDRLASAPAQVAQDSGYWAEQAAREDERKGVHTVAACFDDSPFDGFPEEWASEDVFCRIEYFSDDGDPSVGMPGRCGWQLAADQSGTMLAKLAADAAEDAKLLQLQGGSGQ